MLGSQLWLVSRERGQNRDSWVSSLALVREHALTEQGLDTRTPDAISAAHTP